MALISVSLFGVAEMASGKSPPDFFVVRDGQGTMNPDPPMSITVADGEISYYASGRDVGVLPGTTYTGIGKYVLSIDKASSRQIDSLKAALSSRTFAPASGIGSSTVLAFSFEKDGRH